MKQRKFCKALALILAAGTLISIDTNVFASNNHSIPIDGTDYRQIEKNKLNTVRSTGRHVGMRRSTPEEIEANKNQPQRILPPGYTPPNPLSRAAAYWLEIGRFVYYGQEEDYSCSAAVGRMVLEYSTGYRYTEKEVRTGAKTTPERGTGLYDLRDYLNQEQNLIPYMVGNNEGSESRNDFEDDLSETIDVYWAPPIIPVEESPREGWPYNLPDHSVMVYAMLSDYSEVSLCDPWAGYMEDEEYRWYEITMSRLFWANYDAGGQYLY